MNTSGMSLVNLDWLNSEASALICKECSRIEWYASDVN